MTNICRLCLQNDSEQYYKMDTDEYQHKMQSVIPEIDIEMVEEPFMCAICADQLLTAYTFKCNCLQTDGELKRYAKDSKERIKLDEFLKQQSVGLLSNVKQETIVVNHTPPEDFYKIVDVDNIIKNEIIDLEKDNLPDISDNFIDCDVDVDITNKPIDEIPVEKVEMTNNKVVETKLVIPGKTFNKQRHKIVVNKCPICNKIFLRKSTLDRHVRWHKAYKCSVCDVNMPCKTTLENHMRTHTGERPYQCTFCGNAFAQSSTLGTHVRSVHMSERPYVCELCGKSFPVRGAYTSHKRRRHEPVEKKFVCSFCGKAYRIKSILERHMKWHTGERDYLCHVCSKGFVDKASLKKHLRIHNGEKPYECPLCQKTFTQNYNMKVHEKSCSRRNRATDVKREQLNS